MNYRLFSIFCPILFAAYPAIFLFAANSNYIPLSDLYQYLIYSSSIVVTLMAAIYGIVRSLPRASFLLVITTLTIIFYQYPAYLLKGLSMLAGFDFIVPNIILFILWILLGFKILIFGLRGSEAKIMIWQKILGVIAISLTAMSLWQIISSKQSQIEAIAIKSGSFSQHQAKPLNQIPPSIIYLVLDGFGRSDLLTELYQFNNHELIDFLKGSGFYIAEQSLTNYPQTLLSLASSLNGEYLENIIPEQITPGSEREILSAALNENSVAKLLSSYGYSFTSFASGLAPTSLTSAPGHRDAWPTNAIIEGLAFDLRLPFIGDQLSDYLADNHRNRVLGTFDELAAIVPSKAPQFIFAHIISPHPPFLFGEQGETLKLTDGFTVADGVIANKDPNYVAKYRAQAKFIAKKTIELVAALLSKEPKPIIIIQGDHGPGSLLNWDDMNLAAYHERYPILNAYFLPSQDYTGFYPSISPVNSFRVVFNSIFDTKFDTLPDHHYFAPWDKPFALKEISDKLGTQP